MQFKILVNFKSAQIHTQDTPLRVSILDNKDVQLLFPMTT